MMMMIIPFCNTVAKWDSGAVVGTVVVVSCTTKKTKNNTIHYTYMHLYYAL